MVRRVSSPRAVALALLLVLAGLAGCLGGGGGPKEGGNATLASAAPTKALNATAANATDDGSQAANKTLGSVPHNHDYWKGRERVTILDADEALSPTGRDSFMATFGETRPALGAVSFTLPDGQIVFEGTGKMEVTATWSDPTISGLSLRYHGADTRTFTDPAQISSGAPLGFEVKAEQSDEPHSSSSKWAFVLEAGAPGTPGVANGNVHVKIDIVKMRNIELFPAHPDYFAQKPYVKLMDKDVDVKGNGMAEDLQALASRDDAPPGFAPDHVVPMETKTILVKFDVKSVTSQNPTADLSKFYFLYRAADTAFRYRPANVSGHEEKAVLYKIPVGQGQGDAFYAKTSQWLFYPYFQDNAQGAQVPLPCPPFGECFSWEIQGHVTAYAFNSDVGPEALAKAMAGTL